MRPTDTMQSSRERLEKPLSELIQKYNRALLSSCSPGTAYQYCVSITNWLLYLQSNDIDPHSATSNHIQRWVKALRSERKAESTIRIYTGNVIRFQQWLSEQPEDDRRETTGSIEPTSEPRQTEPIISSAETNVVEALLDIGGTVAGLIASVSTHDRALARLSKSASDDVISRLEGIEKRLASCESALDDVRLSVLEHAEDSTAAVDIDAVLSQKAAQIDALCERAGQAEKAFASILSEWSEWKSRLMAMESLLGDLASEGRASHADAQAVLDAIAEESRKLRSAMYQIADEPTRVILMSQPEQARSCAEEARLIVDGAFRGLATASDLVEMAKELDIRHNGGMLAKLHRALLALDAYAQGDFDGDFHTYCLNAPNGMPVISAQSVARHEANATDYNDRFRSARTFPVPTSISESGSIYMPEHIQLGNGGVSPRLHYYDDRRGITKKVWIGYIGPHLASRDTN